MARQKITTFLWYDGQAEEAATLYTSLFENSRILEVIRYGEGGPGPKGSVMTVKFALDDVEFVALNGGPMYRFTEAISLFVSCGSQREVDDLWTKLSAGGEEGPCGWLKDRFGLSWQIIPEALPRLIGDPDAAKSQRVVGAMLQMKKLDIARLEAAARGE